MSKSDLFKYKLSSLGAAEALWMILSAVGWATMVAVARGLKDDLHVFEISFFRSFFATMIGFLQFNEFPAIQTWVASSII